jgi:ABC-2 type transport system ATP-binding protein
MMRADMLTKQFRYGSLALYGVSLTVADGEICTLVGANGAGKTTTLHCFLDFVRPDAGTAWVDGIAVAAAPRTARRSLAYVAEQVAAYPTLTGRENVRFFARLGGRGDCSAREAGDVLARLGLAGDAIDRPVRTYSKGMRQRVGLATAIACGTRNLILDEPTSGLDPRVAGELMQLLCELRRDGCAVLTSSHDLARTQGATDTVVCLERGRVVASGRADALNGRPLEHWYANAVAQGASA